MSLEIRHVTDNFTKERNFTFFKAGQISIETGPGASQGVVIKGILDPNLGQQHTGRSDLTQKGGNCLHG